MIRLTKAINQVTIFLDPKSIAAVEFPSDGIQAGAVLIVGGQRIAVVESVEDVIAKIEPSGRNPVSKKQGEL